MFQVMTGDGWSGDITRPCMEESAAAIPFFILFIMLTQFVLVNVVVGFLLEKMVDSASGELQYHGPTDHSPT